MIKILRVVQNELPDQRPRTISGAKSTARSKASYDKDPESGAKSTVRSKVSYDKDPDSAAKSAAISKASYDKDLPKSHEYSAARSKAFYEKDKEASRTLKWQRYVMLCAILYFVWDEVYCIENKVQICGKQCSYANNCCCSRCEIPTCYQNNF